MKRLRVNDRMINLQRASSNRLVAVPHQCTFNTNRLICAMILVFESPLYQARSPHQWLVLFGVFDDSDLLDQFCKPSGVIWLSLFNSSFLRTKESYRSAPSSRQRFDHPPPHSQKTTLTVGPLAASVRAEASVTPGALKAALANLTSK